MGGVEMSDPNCMKCLGAGWYPISLDEPWLKGSCSCVIETEIARLKELKQDEHRILPKT